jgi:hypothetical protein
MKDRWITRTLSENSSLLRRIGAKSDTYDIMWDTSAKLLRIRGSNREWQIPVASAIDAMALLNNDKKWDQSYGGFFNQRDVNRLPEGLEGLYYIHSSDFETVYLGKSDRCIRGRLQTHLKGSSNRLLKNAVQSGIQLSFYCWESPNPRYEESIEIKRLKEAGSLKGQRSEKKPLIEYLD